MALIGISGKMGSGKDVAGHMIQYITSGYRLNDPEWSILQDIISGNRKDVFDDVFKIRKFADPLKDCVCIILGCNRKQLEDRAFKEGVLGKEWSLLRETSSYGSPDVIHPVDHKGLVHIAHTHKETLTPRRILQLLGTEGGRKNVHPDIWVNASMANVDKDDNIIFTDTRFPNELKAIKDRGGISIRLERGGGDTGDHPSETALDDAKFDYIVNNDGDLEDLFSMLEFICEKEGLI